MRKRGGNIKACKVSVWLLNEVNKAKVTYTVYCADAPIVKYKLILTFPPKR